VEHDDRRRPLVRRVALADRLGRLCRALTWHRFVAPLPPGARQQYQDAPAYWLRFFLNDREDDG
jgi:hypothetical protein